MSGPVRLAIVQPAMAPYRFACFSALARWPDVELLVVYLSRGSQPYRWAEDEEGARFPRVVLGSRPGPGLCPLPGGLAGSLRRFGPEVTVVGGWDRPAYYALAASGPLAGRLVVWTESTHLDRRGGHPLAGLAKRALLRRAAGVLVPGSAARDYAASLGVPVRCFLAPNAVDVGRFFPPRGSGLAEPAAGMPVPDGRPVVLYVGRLDPEKGVDVLLRAWARVEPRVPGTLVLAGAGRLESSLRALAARLRLGRVRFAGFVPQGVLPSWYRRASLFVFPSRSDPWGMVINEAMASGLPIVTTTAPGAVADLVVDGENGRVVPPGDEVALARAVEELSRDPEARRRMGRASVARVAGHTPDRWAAAVAAMAFELR